jgi:hypothetical protein
MPRSCVDPNLAVDRVYRTYADGDSRRATAANTDVQEAPGSGIDASLARSKLHHQQTQRNRQQERGGSNLGEDRKVGAERVQRHWGNQIVAETIEAKCCVNRNEQQTRNDKFPSNEEDTEHADKAYCHPRNVNLRAGERGGKIRVLAYEFRVMAEVPKAGQKVRGHQNDEEPGETEVTN